MAKGKNDKLGWQGVVTGTPASDPADNRPDYNKSPSVGDWRGLDDSTPTSDGTSQAIKINDSGSDVGD